MTARTPESAAEALCPFARTFGAPKAEAGCRGPSCALWRWVPIQANDPRFTAAVAKLTGGSAVKHKEAVAAVMADREAHGVPVKPEVGYCGAGGAC
jgi:hypothetical protein